MLKSDKRRLNIISNGILSENKGFGYTVINHDNGAKTYFENIGVDSLKSIIKHSKGETIYEGITHFINERFKPMIMEAGYDLSFYDYDGNILEAFLEPIITEEHDLKIPDEAYRKKSQNTKRVDLMVKTVFNAAIPNDFTLKTDAGEWRPVKDLKDSDGKVILIWENREATSIRIESTIFPNDSNEVIIHVVDVKEGKTLLEHKIEIYVIPTTPTQAESFLRKVLFNQLKRWIDREVIRIKPFNDEFRFWRSSNPDFAYSFKSPNKNTIVLDLIQFVNTAQKPILDDFVEQNNLKHKQNYLRALLDSSEEAGIFEFDREGNEIKISKGPNFNEFLDGKIRRVQ